MSYKLANVPWNDDGTMMTEKLTPLEALKVIRGNIDADIITLPSETECCDIIEKSLKALEIIKNKKVDVYWLIEFFSAEKGLDDYNNPDFTPKKHRLTQKEYDLLKEVLK